ncbi:DEAD/DEAH box helicase [Alkalihalobacterium alkalinitrilicum]|uniref:DEAD/DEAH box helicase n=1 Tax=Alkalihalobacterium alkalinitrilicum TaxID=427920 RepID=UPI00099497D3|nr:DEAD/DEAH box helicase [Alkalihalobacterium alkalinitrilicum]
MSYQSFKDYNLSSDITRALNRLLFLQPTEVQQKVIPIALQKKDLVVKSQTGSGKTAAFSVPICELIDWEENKPQALVLSPTRELAYQVKEDITNIGRYKRIKANAIYGKQSFARQKLELKQKTHVVVGTPGRVLDHIQKKSLNLERLNFLVIDEADEMLNKGFIDQVESIINELPKSRMTMLFSATLPQEIAILCHKYMVDPVHIEIKASGLTTDTIEHSLMEVREDEKLSLLKNVMIIENPDSCIIFCSTQEQVEGVYQELNRSSYPCEKIHGGMKQEDRSSVMNNFKRGNFRYLIATNVAARGIDIENITHVINFDLPLEKESYVHRTGRTGRAGKVGKAISFITPFEYDLLQEIEQYIGFKIPKVDVPTKEDVARKKSKFDEKRTALPSYKKDKSETFNKEIMKLYFNGGKKKKIRAVDFVGTIAKIQGVTADDIGIISIQENASFVEILNGKGLLVLKEMKNTKIKGKQLKVHKAKE